MCNAAMKFVDIKRIPRDARRRVNRNTRREIMSSKLSPLAVAFVVAVSAAIGIGIGDAVVHKSQPDEIRDMLAVTGAAAVVAYGFEKLTRRP